MPDGAPVPVLRIAAGDLCAEIIAWGAVLRDLRLAGRPHPLVLGFDDFDAYPAHSPHFGAICGRYANRIAGGRFTLDGRAHQVERAAGEAHALHGGPAAGFGRRLWRVVEHAPDALLLAFDSPDGDGGYPGAVSVTCLYAIAPDNRLRIVLQGTTDAPTVLNLAQHSYFNLDGAADVSGHRLTIPASTRTHTDAALIPTGDLVSVEGTPYDFRAGRALSEPDAPVYDTNYVLAPERRPEPAFAARLQGGTGVAMELWTTEPGLQFYDACGLNVPVAGLDGRRYGPRAGLCLEPQIWPDAPNHPHFPSAVLRPGETYRQITELRFFG